MFTASVLYGLSRVVRIVSVVAVLFILAGLIGFLTDEVHNTSTVQSQQQIQLFPGQPPQPTTVTVDITQPDPPAAVERLREAQHSSGREFIDDVGDVLMTPFTWLIPGSKAWVQRVIYSVLALILYGFLGQMLADFLRRAADGERRAVITDREAQAAEERRRSGSYVSPA